MDSRSPLLAVLFFAALWAGAAEPRPVTLHGQVVDLNVELKRQHKVDIAAKAPPIWVLKTVDGRIYTLLKTRRSLALFDDPRLRGRELIVKGRVFPKTQVLEVTFIQSVRKGVVHDVFYYCDICIIKFLAPGPCVCCREPVVLMEKPAKAKNAPVD
jgi:hypothetical protein